MKQIAVIHGLNSTDTSFNALADNLPDCVIHRINYNSHGPLADSITQCLSQLPSGPLHLIGHSLGGVISAIIASQRPQITSLVTISAPLGGSRAAAYMCLLPGAPAVLADICVGSPYIKFCKVLQLTIPTLSVISTLGNGMIGFEPSDGVVSLSSQAALGFARHVSVPANHFDVLTHQKTADTLAQFYSAQC